MKKSTFKKTNINNINNSNIDLLTIHSHPRRGKIPPYPIVNNLVMMQSLYNKKKENSVSSQTKKVHSVFITGWRAVNHRGYMANSQKDAQ